MGGITVNARVLRDATRHLKKAWERHQVTAKHARRKPSMENEGKLDEASQELAKETLDAEAVLRKAEGTGLQTSVEGISRRGERSDGRK